MHTTIYEEALSYHLRADNHSEEIKDDNSIDEITVNIG